jgi:hypothetical protein
MLLDDKIDFGRQQTLGSVRTPWTRLGTAAEFVNASAFADLPLAAALPTNGVTTKVIDTAGLTYLMFLLYGTAAANKQVDMQVWGCRPVADDVGNAENLLLKRLLAQFAWTLGAKTGLTGSLAIPQTKLFADTVVAAVDHTILGVDVVSPADDTLALAGLDVEGSAIVQVVFSHQAYIGGGSNATNYNVLWAGW